MASVLSRLDKIAGNCFFAELLAGLQSMQALHQHKPITVAPHQDRDLQSNLQDAFGELVRLLGIERGATLRGHVDARNGKCLALHHGLARVFTPLLG